VSGDNGGCRTLPKTMNDSPRQPTRPESVDPLHGATLQHIVECLAEYHGWEGLGRLIPIRCFTHDPSVASSLKFLRKTPWARAKVEALYVETWRRDRGL